MNCACSVVISDSPAELAERQARVTARGGGDGDMSGPRLAALLALALTLALAAGAGAGAEAGCGVLPPGCACGAAAGAGAGSRLACRGAGLRQLPPLSERLLEL